MALKGPRTTIDQNISYTCSNAAERGVVLVLSTSGSGISQGDSAGIATLSTSASGTKPLGILMNDVVSLDETLYHRNFHKDTTKTGERCTLLKKGTVTTNKVTGTPAVNDVAYLTSNGVLTPTNAGAAATPPVGVFDSILDENGYAKVSINLP